MLVRNILLAIGALCLLGGVVLSVVWFTQMGREGGSTIAEKPVVVRPAVLVAAHEVAAGTLLRQEDMTWKEVSAGEIQPGNLVRGQTSDAEFIGAITRRSFSSGELLIAGDLVKPSERQFLAAVLKPGTRAVSLAVEAPLSTGGLILPGDRVDVILTQSFEEPAADPTRKSVAETVLRDVQVVAVDQSLTAAAPKITVAATSAFAPTTDARVPRTVTFEVTEQQAERLFVAVQLGRLQLSVRPLQISSTPENKTTSQRGPTWASDVSPALRQLGRKDAASPTSIDNSVRRAPVMSQ